MTAKRESSLDVGSLLTIDVAAEVRKLGSAQLAGPWQVPGELASRAIRAGAKLVSISFDRRGFSVRDDGRPIPESTLRSLAAVLDPDAAPADRHAALVSLETEGEISLVALAGSGADSLSIASGATLRWTRTTGPVIHAAAARATVIEAQVAVDRAEARSFLAGSFRFLSTARVEVEGATVSQGFANAVAAEPLRRLPGQIALPREGESARVWLLLDGVVVTHVGVPSAPCFEAAVEMRGLVGPRGGAQEARDAIAPHLDELARAAGSLAAKAARRISGLPEMDRARVRSAILVAAKHGSREAAEAAAFRAIAAGGVERWLSVRDLQALATGGRALTAIYPHLDPGAFVLPPASTPALVLDAADRARLAPLAGTAFVAPPARPPSRSRFARALDAFLASLASWRSAFSKPIPDAALAPAERALLDALRARLRLDVAFCEGRSPARPRKGRLFLARENDLVRASVAAVARDPRLAPLAAVALAPESAV